MLSVEILLGADLTNIQKLGSLCQGYQTLPTLPGLIQEGRKWEQQMPTIFHFAAQPFRSQPGRAEAVEAGKDTMRDSKIDWQQQELRHSRWLPITGGDHPNESGKKIEVQVGHVHSAQHEHICSLAIYVIYRYSVCIRCSDEHELSRSISSTAFLLFS